MAGILRSFNKGRRETLEATGKAIARALDKGVAPRDLASLSKRLVDIQTELEALGGADADVIQLAAAVEDTEWDAG